MADYCTTVGRVKKSWATTSARLLRKEDIVSTVDKAAEGDFKAFGNLYSTFLDQIYRYFFYQIKDRMTAEDMTEEVFVKAWKSIETCKGRGDTFSSWLYRIAHNHMINTLKEAKKYTSIEKLSLLDVIDPRQQVEINTEYKELLNRIGCLPDAQRQIVILKFIEGFDNQKIAGILGKKEGTIRVLQMRALATLRKKTGGGSDER